MIKQKLYLILRDAFLGFCFYFLHFILYFILLCFLLLISIISDLNYSLLIKSLAPNYYTLMFLTFTLTILVKIFYKNINREHLIVILCFYTIFSYLTYFKQSADVITFFLKNIKFIIGIPFLPVLTYFLIDRISGSKFFKNIIFKTIEKIKGSLKINYTILLALKTTGIFYLITLTLQIIRIFLFNNKGIFYHIPEMEVSFVLSILFVLINFTKKHKKCLNKIEKLKFAGLLLLFSYIIPSALIYLIWHLPFSQYALNYYKLITILVTSFIKFFFPFFILHFFPTLLYVSIINNILNTKYIIQLQKNSESNTNKLMKYLIIFSGIFISLSPIYLVNKEIINILPVNILLTILPLLLIYGLLKLVYREVKEQNFLEFDEEDNQAASG